MEPRLSPDQCPADPEETAEAFCLHHLSPRDAGAFAAHCRSCPACAARLESAREFIEILRRAEARLRDEDQKPPNS